MDYSLINLSKIICESETFAVITHIRPDGDAISSSLSIFWYLIDIGKKATNIDIIIPEFISDFSFVPGIENLKKMPTKKKYDLVIVVDCSNTSRIQCANVLSYAKTSICFDHHEQTSINSTYSIIDPSASSCTCIIYETLHCTKKEFLYCIATGLISDTSNLTLNVTDKSTSIINQLKKLNIDINKISSKISSPSDRVLQLTKIAKERGNLYSNHSIFCTYLLQKDLLDSEKSLNTLNHKAIISELQNSVKYSSLILLIENNKGEFRGSLRTFDNKLDLNAICSSLVTKGKLLKGGGHSYSSGCTASGSYNDIFNSIISEIISYSA